MTSDLNKFSRRRLIGTTGAISVTSALGVLTGACDRAESAAPETGTNPTPIRLQPLLAKTEKEGGSAPAPLPWDKRVGFAIVGLGRLALEEILPAFAQSKLCKPVALVSGNPDKARQVAAQYGIDAKSLYDYKTYDRLGDNSAVDVVYVVLPNGMHAEYTTRAARAGKHVLCEKPMANSVAECEQMIEACKKAERQLMVAYRMQYEPYNREIIRLARAGEIGKLKAFLSVNGQNQGDPKQWRLNLELAGGGALPDVGIYCLNAARYLSGEEPTEVQAFQYSTPNDPRFSEVEEQINFTLRFPSGFMASCVTSYGMHDSKQYRLIGETGWVELDPAYPYTGQTMRIGRKRNGAELEEVTQPHLESKNQFALELDHMATCVRKKIRPHTPGEEGLQDMRIIAAIYESARTAGVVKIQDATAAEPTRGPDPD